MIMRITSKDFRVMPGERLKLGDRPTSIEAVCKPKMRYQELLEVHVKKLSQFQMRGVVQERETHVTALSDVGTTMMLTLCCADAA